MSESPNALLSRDLLKDRMKNPGPKNHSWVNISFYSSRLASLARGRWSGFFFPRSIHLGNDGITTQKTNPLRFWEKEEEHIAYKRIFGIKHKKGLVWDAVTITSAAGDANALTLKGLPKSQARLLVHTIQKKI